MAEPKFTLLVWLTADETEYTLMYLSHYTLRYIYTLHNTYKCDNRQAICIYKLQKLHLWIYSSLLNRLKSHSTDLIKWKEHHYR